MVQMKEQSKTPEKELNEMEISRLSDAEDCWREGWYWEEGSKGGKIGTIVIA